MKNRYLEFKELNLIKQKIENLSNRFSITFLNLIYDLIINEKILTNLSNISYPFYLFLKENKNFSIDINEAGIFDIFFIQNNLNELENKYIDFNQIEFILKPKYNIFTTDSLTNFFHYLKDFLKFKKVIQSKLEDNNLKKFITSTSDFKELYYILDNSIDLRGYIKDNATNKLKEIRNEIKALNNTIPLKLREFIEKNEKYLNSKDVTIRNNRYVILLNNQYISFFDGIIQDYSSTHKTAFFEPNFIVPLNNKLAMLLFSEQEEIQKVLISIYNYITKNLHNLSKAFKVISVLSFLQNYYKLSPHYCKCDYSYSSNSNLKDKRIKIEGIINPIIKNCVEVDLNLEKKVILITAPNTAGKTTLMKSIVILSIFNNLDLPVFAKSCRLPKFDKIFFEFNDFQDLEANLSTFSSHIAYWNEILEYLENKTKEETVLIILDEGVSGTDPLQAAALTIALINELSKFDNTYIIFSTHYNEVKEYVLNNQDNFSFACIEFDYHNLESKYKLIYNSISSSLGIEIASKLGLKSSIINESYQILNNLKTNTTNFNTYLEKISEYNKLIQELKEKEKEVQNKMKEIENFKEKIIKETYKNAYNIAYKNITKKLNEKINEIIHNWQSELELLKQKNKINKIENQLKSIKNYKLPYQQDKEIPNFLDTFPKEIKKEIKIGDIVFVRSLNLEGEVINISKNKILIKSDNLVYQVDKNDITK